MGLDPVGCIRRRIDRPGWTPFRPKMDWSRMSIPNWQTLLKRAANEGGFQYPFGWFFYLGPIVCLVRASSAASVRRCWVRTVNCHWLQPCSVHRTSDFRCGSSSAAMLFNSIDSEPRIWMAVNGNDPHIRRLAAILGFGRRRSSDSNSSGKPRIRIAVNLGFKRRGDPRIRIAMRTLVLNGDEPPIQTALGNGYEWWRTSVSNKTIHLDLETFRTCGITRKPSKGSFCFRILRVFNRWRMGQELVGCGWRGLNRLKGRADCKVNFRLSMKK